MLKIKNPQTLSGENILPKFILDLADIFTYQILFIYSNPK